MNTMNGRLASLFKTTSFVLMISLIAAGAWAVRVVNASIPDSSGVIHACYDSGNGLVRVVDKEAGETCRQQEKALSWNQSGPQGAAGPRGPSNGYVTSVRGPGTNVDSTTTVLSLSLPAGDYIFTASANVQRDRAGTSKVICGIRVGGGAFSPIYGASLDGVEDLATITSTGGTSLTEAVTVSLECFAIGDAGSVVTGADLTAIRVAEVTRQ